MPGSWTTGRMLLIGGALLFATLWLSDRLLTVVSAGGSWLGLAIAGLLLLRWLRSQPPAIAATTTKTPLLTRAIVESRLEALSQQVTELTEEYGQACTDPLPSLRSGLQTRDLKLAVVGAPGVGKTSLVNALARDWQPRFSLELQDTFCLFRNIATAAEAFTLPPDLLSADLILFVIQGDLSASELRCLQSLLPQSNVLVICNSTATAAEAERERRAVAAHLAGLVSPEAIVSVSAIASDRTGIASLLQRLDQWLSSRSLEQHLLQAVDRAINRQQAWLTAQLFEQRRLRAIAAIDRTQWLVAGTVFLNPVPSLDLIATVAANGQMLVEIGGVFQQRFSVEQAKAIALSLGDLLIKLGLVEWSTQTLAGLLKSSGLAYVAGGAVQAISAAYLTRVVGITLIEFHRRHPHLSLETPEARLELSRLLPEVLSQEQRSAVLTGFYRQAKQWLSQQPALPASAS
ncbi:conserved hypothetical protein [Synechococcus elongatus PCC 7942 = FACHB-805]|uniref:G domain-containing protein n=3 Tax=Synechococcus elongatus TaxID=32046 RepID=Q31PJ6_SYNE7|nr:conserved hypothetical protein [Synechococcus elongatus PCC 7942 = FACHB-805]